MPSLAARLATGDPSAFAELYDACADRLHGYLLFRLRNPEAAADVLQETFLRLVRAGRKLRKVEDIEGYVFRVAHNERNAGWPGIVAITRTLYPNFPTNLLRMLTMMLLRMQRKSIIYCPSSKACRGRSLN